MGRFLGVQWEQLRVVEEESWEIPFQETLSARQYWSRLVHGLTNTTSPNRVGRLPASRHILFVSFL